LALAIGAEAAVDLPPWPTTNLFVRIMSDNQ